MGALAAQRKEDQILRTVVARDFSPGGLCVHETRDDHSASEKYRSGSTPFIAWIRDESWQL